MASPQSLEQVELAEEDRNLQEIEASSAFMSSSAVEYLSLEDSLSTASSADTSTSLVLNPNSTVDNEDLPGIALLKEIFPDESTESLRELHYQHIMANKTQSASRKSSPTGTEDASNSSRRLHTSRQNIYPKTEQNLEFAPESTNQNQRRLPAVPSVQLPNDFLRLPTSVAVVRQSATDFSRGQSRYEFISDLEARALQEYQLATSNGRTQQQETDDVEYQSFVVERDSRWGLGMTLQEEEERISLSEQNIFSTEALAALYGLRVVGFLPDPSKLERGEIISTITISPAELAGVQLGDVLIGINGGAFLLPALSPSLSNQELGILYKNQKTKIVQSIQQSPNPVVLHVRRQKSVDEKKLTGDRLTSLLDTTFQDMEDDSTLLQQKSSMTAASPNLRTEGQSPSSFDGTKRPTLPQFQPSHSIHPLAKALVRRKLILSNDDQWRITFRLQYFTERTRQWEASNEFRLSKSSLALIPYFDPKDLPPDMAALMAFSQNEAEEKKSSASSAVDDDCSSDEPQPGQHQASCGTINAPSTPPLPVDSPLIPFEYLQAFFGDDLARQIRPSSSQAQTGTARQNLSRHITPLPNGKLPDPRRLFQRRPSWDPSQNNVSTYPGYMSGDILRSHGEQNGILCIPLHGIRKSLSARIVNSFVEERGQIVDDKGKSSPRMAYTVWVYDVESGGEWYAPIRYWQDFCDLRVAAIGLLPPSSNLHRDLSSLKFPKELSVPTNNGLWNTAVFSRASPLSPLQDRRRKRQIEEFEDAREHTCRVFEQFLRELLGAIYTCEPLHPNTAEITLYVQSFLGVEAGLADEALSFDESKLLKSSMEREDEDCRQLLKRSIQLYTWRVFLLHTMKAIVRDFVESARSRGPKLQDIEALEAQGRVSLKSRALDEIGRIQAFLDHLVDLVLDGCNVDLRLIASRQEYTPIRKFLTDETYWDRLVRDSVREQVEIEVYAPLRSVVSRLLVNGWRHEDMEVHFKIKELRKRPQAAFRIPEDKISPSHWQSVAHILKQGVGMSTLPCLKLRAIVEAAREISRLYAREHGERQMLGADDFLPIFIFCVVRAEMERPCALCVLLRTLCDRTNRIGEIGYFLASFEAAITHIQELDLTEDRDETLSYMSASLTEVSLND